MPLPPDALTCSASARGVREAIRDGAAVINMSYGSQRLCRAEYAAIQLAVRRGIIPVAAAGNEFAEGNPLEFPASLPHVLTIAAVNARLDSSSFSNSNPAVDLSAPGESIMTAVPPALDDDGTPDGYTAPGRHQLLGPDGLRGRRLGARGAAGPHARPGRAGGAAVGARPRPRGLRQRHGLRAARRRRRAATAGRRRATRSSPTTTWCGSTAGPSARPPPPVFRGRATARLSGLVDAYEDPADVYRVRVRRRSDVRVIAKPTFGDPVLAGFSSGIKSLATCSRRRCRSAPRLATSRRKGKRTERITLRNRTGRTRTFYVALGAQSGARALDAGYRLTIKRL